MPSMTKHNGRISDSDPKHAFIVPNTKRVVTITNGEADRTQIPKATAKARGYQLHAWPEDALGHVDAAELPEHCPDPEQPIDPALAAKWEGRVALLNTPEAQAHPDAAHLIRDNETMSLDDKRAFLRGLPTTSTNIEPHTDEGISQMTPYANQPAGQEARALEIKLGGLARKAENGDHAAKATAAKVRSAALVAEASGKPLHAVLTELGITL